MCSDCTGLISTEVLCLIHDYNVPWWLPNCLGGLHGNVVPIAPAVPFLMCDVREDYIGDKAMAKRSFDARRLAASVSTGAEVIVQILRPESSQ